MVINLGFVVNREVLIFKIEGKEITYFDRKWKNGVRFMPKDPELIKKLIFSRNKIPMAHQVLTWINESNSGKNLKEYQSAKTEEDLAGIVRKDAKKKGLVEFKVKAEDIK